jgi:hypothetical protein
MRNVRAQVITSTESAPACKSTLEQASAVAPVVYTSSTKRTRPFTGRDANRPRTLSRRSIMETSACRGPSPARNRDLLKEAPNLRATPRAKSSAWSKPARRARRPPGTKVTRSPRSPARFAVSAIRRPMASARPRTPRRFNESVSERAGSANATTLRARRNPDTGRHSSQLSVPSRSRERSTYLAGAPQRTHNGGKMTATL